MTFKWAPITSAEFAAMRIQSAPAEQTTPWRPGRTADVLAIVAGLRDRPGDTAMRGVLADLLDEHGPTPVEYGHLPRWFRLCWCRCVPVQPGTYGPRAGWNVEQEVRAALQSGYGNPWDHWGRTTIAGLECLVVEPYARLEESPGLLAPLSALMPGTLHAHAMWGAWRRSTVRGLLFPPLTMPPPARKKRAS